MKSINLHSDTLMWAALFGGPELDLYDFPKAMIDFQRMKAGELVGNFFAIWMVPPQFCRQFNKQPMPEEEYIARCIEILERSVAAHSDMIAKAASAQDLLDQQAEGKLSAVLAMEDGCAVHGKMENLKRFYDMGVRAISLTWNYENCFGFPNSQDPAIMAKGLTDFGKEAVGYMQELGILVDVSHLSDGGFYDVASLCKKPFIATHSNCRALSPHTRNLTDDMIRVLADHGGVMGINFGPEFLNEDITDRRSTVERMVAMARHARDMGGIDVVAIGTDFDGIRGELEISDCSQMDRLAQGLSKGGFTDDEIEQIFYRNVVRVMKDAIG